VDIPRPELPARQGAALAAGVQRQFGEDEAVAAYAGMRPPAMCASLGKLDASSAIWNATPATHIATNLNQNVTNPFIRNFSSLQASAL
jgi:hypothetical protein